MATFSADRAIGAGFKLIRREPLALLVWALVYLLLGVLPQVWMFSMMAPLWSEMARSAASAQSGSGTLPTQEMFRAQATMMQVQPISWLSSIVCQTLLYGAVYRAALFPEDRKFFYLRTSTRELWLGLVLMVLLVMMIIAMFVVILPTSIIVGIAAAFAGGSSPFTGLLMVPIVFAAMGVVIWLMLRLSLALPMSFAEPGFRLFESWGATRGQAGKMFGVALAIFLLLALAEVIVGGGGFALFTLLGGQEGAASWFEHPHVDMATLLPWVIGGGLLLSLLAAAFFALVGAAWAEIYSSIETPVSAF